MEILAATFRLIFSANPNGPVGTEYPVLVFAVACGFMGGVIVLLDWVTVLAGRESVLKLVYRGPNILILLLIWGAGAGLAGFLGGAFGIFELGRSASIAVGVAWHWCFQGYCAPRTWMIQSMKIFKERGNESI